MRLASTLPLIALLAVAAAGCDDDRSNQLPTAPAEVAPDELSAYVVVSEANPGIGTQFTVSVRARRGSAVGPIGSFTIRLAFDTTRLRFREAARSESSGGMVMANVAEPGLLIAAGASATGFTSDDLLVATFSALSADAIRSLALSVTELNSVTFEDQRDRVRVSREIFGSPKRTK
jgi:hypothetical protein